MQRAMYLASILAIAFSVPAMWDTHAPAQQGSNSGAAAANDAPNGDLPSPRTRQNPSQQQTINGRPYLGVTFEGMVHDAAVVRSVTPGSPADLSGLVRGDTIVSLNGREISSYDDALRTVAAMRPGDLLDIKVSRQVTIDTQAVLDTAPGSRPVTVRNRPNGEPLPRRADNRNQNETEGSQAHDNQFLRGRGENQSQRNRSDAAARDDNDDDDRDRARGFRGRFLRRRG